MGASAESVIAEGAFLSGKVAVQDITILGRFEGELEVKARLRVGPKASVKAVARAGTVELNGEFDGQIRAVRLAFGDKARARGTFYSDRVSMEEGAWVEGTFNPVEKAAVAAAQPAASSQPAPSSQPMPTAQPVPTTQPVPAAQPVATPPISAPKTGIAPIPPASAPPGTTTTPAAPGGSAPDPKPTTDPSGTPRVS